MGYKKKIIGLIVLASTFRLLLASSINLGNDEVYYRIYAQELHWNYFDHPPLVAWLIRFTTYNLVHESELFIRLGAILSAATCSWLLFIAGKKLKDERTGFLAALIYNFSIYGCVIAGTLILPDAPQMVCWTAALVLMINLAKDDAITKDKEYHLILFGLVTGLGMISKIHSIFLWFALLVYLLVYQRKWFSKPSLYISGTLTLIIFAPVIKWNFDHHFVTYLYHSKRVNVANGGVNLVSFARFTIGQFIYISPILIFSLFKSAYDALKGRLTIAKHTLMILLFTAFPLITTCLFISLFKDVLPHWTGPAYTGLILITAVKLSDKRFSNRLLCTSGLFLTILSTLAVLFINFYSGTIGNKSLKTYGKGDLSLDMYGWDQTRISFQSIYKSDIKNGKIDPGAYIISNKWFPAAHIDHYIAQPLSLKLIAVGELADIHQYAWLNQSRKFPRIGENAYCLIPSDHYFDPLKLFGSYFKKIELECVIPIYRTGKLCRRVYVYRLVYLKTGLESLQDFTIR